MTLRLIFVATLTLGVLGFSSGPHAQEAKAAAAVPTEVKRTILERHDQSGVPDKEIVLGTAELPAGAVIGWHVHPGDESGYVLRGDLILKVQGQPDRVLKAGDHFFNLRGTVHSMIAAPGTGGGMAVSSWIIDKGKPLADAVKVDPVK
jgi:quercetin dioxygenase-like cupin family protein